MPADSKRVTVAIPEDVYKLHSHIARLLNMEVREATSEAVKAWNDKNALKAQKRAAELLKPAA